MWTFGITYTAVDEQRHGRAANFHGHIDVGKGVVRHPGEHNLAITERPVGELDSEGGTGVDGGIKYMQDYEYAGLWFWSGEMFFYLDNRIENVPAAGQNVLKRCGKADCDEVLEQGDDDWEGASEPVRAE